MNVPFAFKESVPCSGGVTGVVLTVRLSLSGSESLVKTFPDIVWFIFSEKASSTATGGLLRLFIVIVTVAWSVNEGVPLSKIS